MAERALPEEAVEVFRARPEAFIETRDALVARLREESRDEDAAAVKSLRKPTLVVWALNQLGERSPDGVQALLDAGRELRAAQQAAVSTASGADRLREATAARRAAVASLVEVGAAALAETGRGAATQTDAVAAALETASIDPEAGAHLAGGTFQQSPAAPPGFGDVFGLASIPGGAAGDPKKGAKTSVAAKADLTRLRRERDRAVKTARSLREAADRLGTAAAETRSRLRDLETQHGEAVQRALASETDAKRAERELGRAERAR